jgi:hypothetical protein
MVDDMMLDAIIYDHHGQRQPAVALAVMGLQLGQGGADSKQGRSLACFGACGQSRGSDWLTARGPVFTFC